MIIFNLMHWLCDSWESPNRWIVGVLSRLILGSVLSVITAIYLRLAVSIVPDLPWIIFWILVATWFIVAFVTINLGAQLGMVAQIAMLGGGPFSPYLMALIAHLLLIPAVLFVLWAIPAMVIYWAINPDTPKRAIQIGVLFISIGGSMLCLLLYPQAFPKISDKVSFVAGTITTPVVVIEVIF